MAFHTPDVSAARVGVAGERSAQLASGRVESAGQRAQLESCSALAHAWAPGPSALRRLYEQHAKSVYRVALSILRSREDAEDLTQEVFASLCGPTAYDPERGSLCAFLTTLTRSRAIDRLRHQGRSARLVRTWHEALPSARAPEPFDQVSRQRAAERLCEALADLPGALRQVVEMAYYRGLSQREIADELETPLGTVKTRSRRALLALGRALEDFVA